MIFFILVLSKRGSSFNLTKGSSFNPKKAPPSTQGAQTKRDPNEREEGAGWKPVSPSPRHPIFDTPTPDTPTPDMHAHVHPFRHTPLDTPTPPFG